MKKPPRPLRHSWILDAFQEEPSFFHKSMFGCRACYLHGRLQLVIAPSAEEPWKGVLVCTSHEWHESLRKDFPQLKPHTVLGKWLYVREDSEDFEDVVSLLLERIISRDPRIGVEPGKRNRSRKLKVKSRK